MSDDTHRAMVSLPNPDDASLVERWVRPEFEAIDGIGPEEGLSAMGGLILSVGSFANDRASAMGSGVMVAPGIMVTATHVLEEIKAAGHEPVVCSFLPGGAMRIWFPRETNHAIGPGPFTPFGAPPLPKTSDISLVSCELMSDPCDEHPLLMAHIEARLPLVGDRLWAVGYREVDDISDVAGLNMFISSGLVTECYPHGRGHLLGSPCVEVAMNTLGGMSGGPVFNEEGHLVGIVSRSFEADDQRGPTYVTLVWDALRLDVTAHWPPGRWPGKKGCLVKARDLGLAKIIGDLTKDDAGNVTLTLSEAEIAVLIKTAPEGAVTKKEGRKPT